MCQRVSEIKVLVQLVFPVVLPLKVELIILFHVKRFAGCLTGL